MVATTCQNQEPALANGICATTASNPNPPTFNMLPDYLAMRNTEKENKKELSSPNMISIQVVNNKTKPDGHPGNASITHHDLFYYMVYTLKLNINSVKCLTSSNMTTVIHNNMLKYIQFTNPSFDSGFLIGSHMVKNHNCHHQTVQYQGKACFFPECPAIHP